MTKEDNDIEECYEMLKEFNYKNLTGIGKINKRLFKHLKISETYAGKTIYGTLNLNMPNMDAYAALLDFCETFNLKCWFVSGDFKKVGVRAIAS